MAQYKFEGDISNLNEHHLAFMSKIISQQDIQVDKVTVHPVGEAGDNYVANVKRIKIEGSNRSMKMIVKIAPTNEAMRKSMHIDVVFHREQIMYTEVLPKLVSLQKAAGVPEDEHLRYAKCYGSKDEAPNEMIILEDLTESDFVMLDKYVSLTDESVKSILKNFATLHSLSYVLKNKEPDTYEQFKSKLPSLWPLVAGTPEFDLNIELIEKAVLSLLENEVYKSVVRNKTADMFKALLKLSKEDVGKHGVIIQGDAWTNNVMFKFVGDTLVQSCMIDYQISYHQSPAMDVLYMIFNCTDHETRSKNFYNWIDYYHTELDKNLSNFGLKANLVYPRDQLDADMKRFARPMLGMSLLLFNLLMRDAKEASVVKENIESGGFFNAVKTMNQQELQKESLARGKKRMEDLINSCITFGLIHV
ncbi:hypothetical protein HF086_011924 [Spodoptera exigua]|uniref:CHK kinase-like domain-containing protein n=1 Tax=Spodoptera exigua TaxID=7107 RepID=A0A922SCD6_SPOEX|nr:hypothetical protein HF086_011924 [Spodoptera exigua]